MLSPSPLEHLLERITDGESLEVELKHAAGGLPRSLWDTVSAFANTAGGWIILGIDTSTSPISITGVHNPDKLVQDFYNLANNPQKLSYRACGPYDVHIDQSLGVSLIVIRVPLAPLRHRPIYINGQAYGGTFVRANEGDFQCTKIDVDRMMRDASDVAADSSIVPGSSLEDIDAASLALYRRMHAVAYPDSPNFELDDREFCIAHGAYAIDRSRDVEGLTVAGILMLGTDTAVQRWRPRHLIDYRKISDSLDWDYRWDDRVLYEGNVLKAFQPLYDRLTADLPVPFQLAGPVRTSTSALHVAVREALVNLLVHADYAEPAASLILRSVDGYRFRNPGTSRVPIADLATGYDSIPRNPRLVRMFRRIGLAEEAGSGMARIYGAWRESRFLPPKIIVDTERYQFDLTLSFSRLISLQDQLWLDQLPGELSAPERMVLVYAKHEGEIDNQSVRSLLGIHSTDATRVLVGLRDRGCLVMAGTGRGARYALAPQAVSIIESSTLHIRELRPSPPNRPAIDWPRLEVIAAPAREVSKLSRDRMGQVITQLCAEADLSMAEIATLINRNPGYVRAIVADLRNRSSLEYVFPDSPRRPDQRYRAVPHTSQNR